MSKLKPPRSSFLILKLRITNKKSLKPPKPNWINRKLNKLKQH